MIAEEILKQNGEFKLEKGDIIDFKKLDGMYSLCYKDGKSCHLAGWTEVEILEQPEGAIPSTELPG